MNTAQWYREWADVGTEVEPPTEADRIAAEEAAWQSITEEWDALHDTSQMSAETTTQDGQPF
jgi:hypothetical protein